MAVVAHTIKVGMDPTVAGAVTGVEADVVLAAYYAAEVAAKTIKAGNTNTQVRPVHILVPSPPSCSAGMFRVVNSVLIVFAAPGRWLYGYGNHSHRERFRVVSKRVTGILHSRLSFSLVVEQVCTSCAASSSFESRISLAF